MNHNESTKKIVVRIPKSKILDNVVETDMEISGQN